MKIIVTLWLLGLLICPQHYHRVYNGYHYQNCEPNEGVPGTSYYPGLGPRR
jgi:hypothetical protein